MRSILNLQLFGQWGCLFMWYTGSLCCDLTIYRTDPHVKCGFNPEPFRSLMGHLSSPELSKLCVIHTDTLNEHSTSFAESQGTQRTRPRGISSKDVPIKNTDAIRRLDCLSWAYEIKSVCWTSDFPTTAILPTGIMTGADLSDPQSWCLEKYLLGQFCVHFKISTIIIWWLSDESPFFPKKEKGFNSETENYLQFSQHFSLKYNGAWLSHFLYNDNFVHGLVCKSL